MQEGACSFFIIVKFETYGTLTYGDVQKFVNECSFNTTEVKQKKRLASDCIIVSGERGEGVKIPDETLTKTILSIISK